jgi:DNA-binding response OmpR family regulator
MHCALEVEALVSAESPSKQTDRACILVVEDNEEIIRFLDALLVANGYAVVLARNGVEAMVALTAPQREAPDLVLLDLGLPLESGVSVLTFLRNVMRSGPPVIVLTGRQDPDEEAAVRKLGVSSYLRKPAPSEQVLAAISRALA